MASLLSTIATTLSNEIQAWQLPPGPPKDVAPVPRVGDFAPQSDQIPFPSDKPTIVVFLRHCGCAFAEKTFRLLTSLSTTHPHIQYVAVSHSSPAATDAWAIVCGGLWSARLICDPERELYARWGLGISSAWHVLGPAQAVEAFRLGVGEGIWNGQTEGGGSRWQMGGAFAVDKAGVVRWSHPEERASDVPDLKAATRVLEEGLLRNGGREEERGEGAGGEGRRRRKRGGSSTAAKDGDGVIA